LPQNPKVGTHSRSDSERTKLIETIGNKISQVSPNGDHDGSSKETKKLHGDLLDDITSNDLETLPTQKIYRNPNMKRRDSTGSVIYNESENDSINGTDGKDKEDNINSDLNIFMDDEGDKCKSTNALDMTVGRTLSGNKVDEEMMKTLHQLYEQDEADKSEVKSEQPPKLPLRDNISNMKHTGSTILIGSDGKWSAISPNEHVEMHNSENGGKGLGNEDHSLSPSGVVSLNESSNANDENNTKGENQSAKDDVLDLVFG